MLSTSTTSAAALARGLRKSRADVNSTRAA
jgi:hypothetical protein